MLNFGSQISAFFNAIPLLQLIVADNDKTDLWKWQLVLKWLSRKHEYVWPTFQINFQEPLPDEILYLFLICNSWHYASNHAKNMF